MLAVHTRSVPLSSDVRLDAVAQQQATGLEELDDSVGCLGDERMARGPVRGRQGRVARHLCVPRLPPVRVRSEGLRPF